jgi:hypothetical protein
MLEEDFPRLAAGTFRVTSPPNFNNNCLAWAAGDATRWWEKAKGAFWPDDRIPDDEVGGWVRIFQMQGYSEASDSDFEAGFEKVAIYAGAEGPTHAARQLPSGEWTSKLGPGYDIEHQRPEVLEGGIYGAVVQVLRRAREDWLK